jgi:hypothetical protein
MTTRSTLGFAGWGWQETAVAQMPVKSWKNRAVNMMISREAM